MTHSYQITGMTCGGCRSKVEEALNTVTGIDATVTLDPPMATVKMENHVPIEQLQQALSAAGHYTISVGKPSDNTPQSDAKTAKKSCC